MVNMHWVSESDAKRRCSSNWGVYEFEAQVQRGQKITAGEAWSLERLFEAHAANMAQLGVELPLVTVAPDNVWTVTYRGVPERHRVILVVSTRSWGRGEKEMRCAASQVLFLCEAISAGRASELDLHRYDRHSRHWFPPRNFAVSAQDNVAASVETALNERNFALLSTFGIHQAQGALIAQLEHNVAKRTQLRHDIAQYGRQHLARSGPPEAAGVGASGGPSAAGEEALDGAQAQLEAQVDEVDEEMKHLEAMAVSVQNDIKERLAEEEAGRKAAVKYTRLTKQLTVLKNELAAWKVHSGQGGGKGLATEAGIEIVGVLELSLIHI